MSATIGKIRTLAEVRSQKGLSPKDLAHTSGISTGSIARIEHGRLDGSKTQVDVAEALSKALGVEVSDIEWPNGLTEVGRPPFTGVSIMHTGPVKVISEPTCPNCFIILPSGIAECSMC